MHALTRIDKLFNDPFFSAPISHHTMPSTAWRPDVDVYEDQEHVYVSVEVPGIPPDQVEASITGNYLVIKGEKELQHQHEDEHSHMRRVERSYGSFARKIRLPAHVDHNEVNATSEHGVLKISMKKRDLPKKIDISFN